MKYISFVIALAFIFASGGCNKETSNPVSSSAKQNDPNQPTSATTGSTSDACFDIPTPSMGSITQGTITTVGGNTSITVCWNYTVPSSTTYYTTAQWYPQGAKKPMRPAGAIPTSTLNPNAANDPHEFWGG